mmetsp:Transcript_9696/g.35508  ORF Transcript_9696/g.35508 Transcript_9696/m.35508 type:complete len:519 (+) Transcript_9696:199-1755(+)|eukprot:scaffold495_cov405-Prasinococcus_capsulatus_cf.AAC.17
MSKIERLSDDVKKESEDTASQQENLPLDSKEVNDFERWAYRKSIPYLTWYYRDREGKPRGPANISTMRTAYIHHIIDEDTIVYADGYEDWSPVKNVQELLHCLRTPEVKVQRWVRSQVCRLQGKAIPSQAERELELKKHRWKYGLSPPTRKLAAMQEFLSYCNSSQAFRQEFLTADEIMHRLEYAWGNKGSGGNPVMLEEEANLLKLTPQYSLGGKQIFPHMEIMEEENAIPDTEDEKELEVLPEAFSPVMEEMNDTRLENIFDQYLEFLDKVDREGANLDPEQNVPEILAWDRQLVATLADPEAADEDCPYSLAGLRAHKLEMLKGFKQVVKKFEEKGYDYEDFLAKERFFQAYHKARFPNEELAGDDEEDRLSPAEDDINKYLQQRARAWAEIKSYAENENRAETMKAIDDAVQTAFIHSTFDNALDGFKIQPGVLLAGVENPSSTVQALDLEKHFSPNTYRDFLRKESEVFPRDEESEVVKEYFDPLRRNADANSRLYKEIFLVAAGECGSYPMQ